ncbi:alpha-L-fucosidase [Marinilongibacter aquaticus]|uniref:alpha-L-fucosidase n=1 Tax=Marinilongibacter aquaticus TaxID=2975157 RepID=UPI0021BDE759|nr:alpha-L-fucosidase [Marinilongibacter aquaticus]UBM60195.1 alpha-L-fucosidase [Marinilongibacter aquaticus]
MRKFSVLLLFLSVFNLAAQQHNVTKDPYVPPKDPKVIEKLGDWQNGKFGLMMHWGTYSIWGIVESWSLCPEDVGWTKRRGPYADDYFEYKKAYEGLKDQFNPTDFNPEKWADAAEMAGMKYVVFTTKHHDGFCMFDTQQTDYNIMHSAFGKNPRANIANEVFKAFRVKDFMIGAYFSKPDWHTPSYWWPYFPPKDRNPSYDPAKYPEKWAEFKKFTYNQIEELMTNYGSVDILWLDGGWVRPRKTIDPSVEWQKDIKVDQDIDMANIAKMARSHQPGLLMVDRTVGGRFENYVTPEQHIPDHYLPYPWETCMTMGNSWSYVPNDKYKSSRTLIHNLANIVSRNGNLLLNIGPSPQGDFAPEAYDRLKAIGHWMDINSEAIYGTVGDNKIGEKANWVFTWKGDTAYAIYKVQEGETLMNQFAIQNMSFTEATKVSLLGSDAKVKLGKGKDGLSLSLSEKALKPFAGTEALVFKIEKPFIY